MKRFILIYFIFAVSFTAVSQSQLVKPLIDYQKEYLKDSLAFQSKYRVLSFEEFIELKTNPPVFNFSKSSKAVPAEPVRAIAEWEPNQGVVVRGTNAGFHVPTALIKDMADHVIVYVVATAAHQGAITTLFNNNSVNMANVEFVTAATDAQWVRDCMAWFVEYDNTSEIGLIDFTYNRPARVNDNLLPVVFSNYFSKDRFAMDVVHTGGNYMCDGHGVAASTELVIAENPTLSLTDINDYFKDYLGIDEYQLHADPMDDYIDHIDCWSKFLAPDKILVTQVPESDYRHRFFEDVAEYYSTKISSYGTPFQVYRVFSIGDPYTNSLIMNDRVYVPLHGNNAARDNAALAVYQDAMPGYTILGFLRGDANSPWYATDALHCRTYQVPDFDMLRVSHIPYFEFIQMQEEYLFEAEIYSFGSSPAAITSVKLYYQINGGAWLDEDMTNDIGNNYSVSLSGFNQNDEIKYYIRAENNNSRVSFHPFIGQPDAHEFKVLCAVFDFDSEINVCGGPLVLDAGEGFVSYIWDEVPGNQTFTVHESGTYSVEVEQESGCIETLTFDATIYPTAPTTLGDEKCGPGELTLTANGDETLKWYDAPEFGALINTGNSITSTFSETTTYYIESFYAYPATGFAGSKRVSAAGGNSNVSRYMNFTAHRDLTIVSVMINSGGNANRTVNLKDNDGNLIQTINIALQTGIRRYTLNFSVTPGQYRLEYGGGTNLWRNTAEVIYPHEIEDVFAITGSSTGSGQYYYFYDWEILYDESCSTARIPVTATINQNPVINLGDDIVQCGGQVDLITDEGFVSYLWNSSPGNHTYNTTESVNLNLEVTDSNGCSGSDQIQITIHPELIIELQATPESSAGASDGTATVNIINGTPGYTFAWSNGGDTQTITNLAGGIYTVTVSDANDCEVIDNIEVITFDDGSPYVIFEADVTTGCESLTVQFTDLSLNNPTSWNWNFGDENSSILQNPVHTYTSPGTYTVSLTATNAEGAGFDEIINYIVVGENPTIIASNDGPFCEGQDIQLSSTGSSGGDQYLWAGPLGFTSNDANPVRNNAILDYAGVYSVTLTDSGTGCFASETTTVVINESPQVNASYDGPYCEGENINLTATGTGGNSYLWTGPNIYESTDQNPVINTASADDSGQYTVTYTNTTTSCYATDIVDVIVSPQTVAGNVTGGSTINLGETSGTLTLTDNIGEPIRWQSSVNLTDWTDISHTGITYVSDPLFSTTHFRAVVQSGTCDFQYSTHTTVVVDLSSIVIIDTLEVDGLDYVFFQFIADEFEFNPTPGITEMDVLIVAGGGGGAGSTGNAGRGGGGAGGVVFLESIAVTEASYNVIVGQGGQGGAAAGASGLQGQNSLFHTYVAIGGGFGGNISTNGGNGGSGGGTGVNNNGFTGGTAQQPGSASGGFGNNGGAGGPWAVGAGAGGGGGAGTEGGTGTDANGGAGGQGLEFTHFAAIGGQPAGWFAGGGGGSAGTTGGAGGDGGGGAGSNNDNTAGNGIDNTGGGGGGSQNGDGGNGGAGTVIISYLLKPTPNFVASQTTICEGEIINFADLSVNAPETWSWTFEGGTPTTSNQQNPSVTYNDAGVYQVQLVVTNTGGSASELKTFYITVNETPLVDNPDNVTACDSYILPALTNGAYFANSGGVNPIAVGANISSTQTIYVYAETGTTPNCFAENSFIVTINGTPLVDNPTDVIACDSYTLPALTNGEYFANSGGVGMITIGTEITSNQTIYVYAETGTTPNCFAENSFIVTINSSPTVNLGDNIEQCGGTATLDAGAGFTSYAWDGIAGDQTFVANASGTYTVVVEDANGCTATDQILVTIHPELSITTESTPESAPGANDGTATVIISGGTPNFDIEWNNGGTTETIIGLSGNTYFVTVTDANNCSAESSIVVNTEAAPPVANFQANITEGCDMLTVQFTDLSTNTPTSWTWDFGDGNNSNEQHPEHTYTNHGLYTVSLFVSNEDGTDNIEFVDYILVGETPQLAMSMTEESQPGAEDGTATVTVTAAYPYTVIWNTGNDTETITNLEGGIYCVTVINTEFSCPAEDCIEVTTGDAPLNPPVANFQADVSQGCDMLTVQFTDLSTNTPTSWTWDFGDGNNSNEQHPEHTYINHGLYTVSLFVSNEDGSDNIEFVDYILVGETPQLAMSMTEESQPGAEDGTATVTVTAAYPYTVIWNTGNDTETITNLEGGIYCVTVINTEFSCPTEDCIEVTTGDAPLNPPVANFQADVSQGCDMLTVQFTDLSTNTPTSWTWDFGDGNNSNEQHPEHTYTNHGLYTVSLFVSNEDGSDNIEFVDYILVGETPQLAMSMTEESQPGAEDGTATVTVTAAYPYTVIWSSGQTSETIENLSAGTYCVTVINTEFSCPTDDCIQVTAGEGPPVTPVANFQANLTSGCDILTVQFSDLSTNTPTNWTWDFGDGNNSNEQNPEHIYTSHGLYSVSLIVSNDGGTDDIEFTDYILVGETPQLALSMTEESELGAEDGTAIVIVTASYPYTVIWNTGDDTETIIGLEGGIYCVTVINTEFSCPAEDCIEVTTADEELYPPVANFQADVTQGCDMLTVQFTDLSENNPTSWLWDFGDGIGSILENPEHTYYNPGEYTVSLNVTNSDGSDNITFTDYIKIGETPEFDLFTLSASGPEASDGEAWIDITAGIPPHTILWSTGETETSVTGLIPGTYSVMVRDAYNCIKTEPFTIDWTTSILQNETIILDVYPNPASSSVFIKTQNTPDLIEFTDIIGKVIYSVNPTNTVNEIDVSSVKTGVYFLKIYIGEESAVAKIVVQ